MKRRTLYIAAVFVFLTALSLMGAGETRLIELTRGRLWHALHYTQECEPLADWRTMSYGLDWPGYDVSQLSVNFGGTYSHIVSAGFYVTAMRTQDPDTVQGWMDFALNGDRNTSWEQGKMPFVARRHERKWKNGENYYCLASPYEAEDIILSEWEKDPQFVDANTENKKFNLNIKRKVMQWSGSKADQDYIITKYVISTLRTERTGVDSAYFLFTYALSPTARAWNYTNPNHPSGARNTIARWNEANRSVTAWAGDYAETSEDEAFGYYSYLSFNSFTNEYEDNSEYMAPAKVGIKLLDDFSAFDTTSRFNGFVWAQGPSSSDYEGPFAGVSGLENKYNAMANPLLLNEAFTDTNDARMGNGRLYANFSFGPYDLYGRGVDSVVIIFAEYVGGADFKTARSLSYEEKDSIAFLADSAMQYLENRVTFNYKHNFTVPVPPPGPDFTITAIDSSGKVGNRIAFSDSVENIADPQEGIVDIAGYRVYRSGSYPMGPWEMIADIPVGDPDHWNSFEERYEVDDYLVAMGYGYYYAITAYDEGHDTWSVDPSVSVPPLESSLYANRSQSAFFTTLRPASETDGLSKVAVVPNPFYLNSGLSFAGDTKKIQFVNLPSVCTIRIFTVRGDLVKTIEHNDNQSGSASWNQISEYGQYIKSGLYFYHIETPDGKETRGKFAIVN